ncbi:DUF305 domain-containing protein [Sphingomicrobium astaxanthinifaciens]|uniref:DUF305 domain-containing protein n=1 Tax=Sphingomicrobium astaxanthinifaciens TaxID=1227949 RepID=UPI001FCCAC90|nr:DUF305 domain-containing protein [Sphingomicrobium astaxanthinifaciens]MCJ7420307.1 DUF305 domain-containing protein [Sphingomicrobium astaxanthinifaciens]
MTNLQRLTCCASLIALAAPAAAQQIILPGAPGEPSRIISPEEAGAIADTSYTEADVAFMQAMIHHHHQATLMADLAEGRSAHAAVLEAAARITASQDDEIAFMRTWLEQRGEHAPDPMTHAAKAEGAMDHDNHGMSPEAMATMAGMASPAEMAALAAAEGQDFDRRFLKLMIAHHEGALAMVRDLLDLPGTARDPLLAEFANDVVADQRAEIAKMNLLLAGLSEDPRVGLAPGLYDAGEAIWNLRKVASLKKPVGFFDPASPSGLPPLSDSDEDGDGVPDRVWDARSPLLSFAQTDMAFDKDKLFVGNYHGFNMYRLAEDGVPELLSSVVCPGGQGDVSVVGDLLIMSVEQGRGRVDCGLEGVSEDVSEERFRGIRIFDISDLAMPRQVGLVQTCRGSHTHSIVDANDERVIVYVSGTAGVRDEKELAGCIGFVPGDTRTALFSIDVVEIPVADPAAARIVNSPRIFADAEGNIAGLWRGGDHGEGTQTTYQTNQCHDITVFPERKIAAGACSGNGILLDISDPMKPVRIDAVTDKGFAYWHSATFNNDGTKVVFTDEWGGGGRPRCRASDPDTWGADAIYDIVDGKLVFRSYYKLPAPQSDEENCVAHNGSAIPVPGRDLFAQAWYQGGLSIMDFTDSDNPVEIAYFDRGPVFDERMSFGGYWSTYFYNGRLYGTEITRGLDVFALEPSDFLSVNEIAAAGLAIADGPFNPQQQRELRWQADPVVALAYLDQLERAKSLDPARIAQLRAALKAGDMELVKRLIPVLEGGEDAARKAALAALLETLAG